MSNEQEYNEAEETVQFYKIQLMEKERQLANIDAKIKKSQFKHNREINELKKSEDKLKTSLKKEKGKYDQASVSLNETTQQNRILQLRLTQLKEQKEKQVQGVRNQYNNLKEQVRSYERILPTHTFMNQLGASIDQLPPYQEIFYNCKDKSQQYENLHSKHESYQKQITQKIDNMTKVMETLRSQKNEAQKQSRESITKILDLQSQNTTSSLELEELKGQFQECISELESMSRKCEELASQNEDLEKKIEEILYEHRSQIEGKEEQIRNMTEYQFKKYQDEIRQLTQRFEKKENSYLQQFSIMEEQQNESHLRMQQEKEKWQLILSQLKQEVQKLKEHLNKQKSNGEEKQQSNLQLREQVILLGRENQSQQKFIKELEGKIQKLQSQFKSEAKVGSEEILKIQEELQSEKNYLSETLIKVTGLQEENGTYKTEVHEKDNEIFLLKNQIQEFKNKLGAEGKKVQFLERNTLEIELQRKSTQEQAIQNIKQVSFKLFEIQDKYKQSEEKIKETQIKCKQMEQKYQDLQGRYQSIKNQHEQLLNKYKQAQEKQKELEQKYQASQINLQEKEKEWRVSEQKLKTQKKQVEEGIGKLQKKIQFHKLSASTLKNENQNLVSDLKNQKENIRTKDHHIRELQRKNKQFQRNFEEVNHKYLQLTKLKEKYENQQGKESKFRDRKLSLTQNEGFKEVREKLQKQIYRLNDQNRQYVLTIENYEKDKEELQKQIQKWKQQNERAIAEIDEKDKVITNLQNMLSNQRKQKTIRTAPSLTQLHPEKELQEEQYFKQAYNVSGRKEGEIANLKRKFDDIETDYQELKIKHKGKVEGLQVEMNEYIQIVINMKMAVAESEMKAAQKTFLYNQLKKKYKKQQQSQIK